jgi:hypothetical protein
MDAQERSLVARLVRNPVAIIGAIGSLFVVLANAEGAIDGARHLWQRWSEPSSGLESTWQGDWKSRNGFHFGFAMQLSVADNGDAMGEISWQLKATPPDSFLAPRVGDVAIEYVRGTFDRDKGQAMLTGYEVSDATLLALDTYKFQIKSDQITFVGMTKHQGDWEAQASGTVIVSEKR